jgi:hypothetical protein
MLYLNGIAIGGIVEINQSDGFNIAKPQIPGTVLSTPYFTGKKHTELEFEILPDYLAGQRAEFVLRYIRDLTAGGGCTCYLYDDSTVIFDDRQYVYFVIEEFGRSRNKDKGDAATTILLKGTVTEDYSDCSYRPTQ